MIDNEKAREREREREREKERERKRERERSVNGCWDVKSIKHKPTMERLRELQVYKILKI